MSTASAAGTPLLPEWADEALEGSYAGEALFVQNEERGVSLSFDAQAWIAAIGDQDRYKRPAL